MLLWCSNALDLGLNVPPEVLLEIAGDTLQVLDRSVSRICNAAPRWRFQPARPDPGQLLRIEVSLLLILGLGKLCIHSTFNLANTAVTPSPAGNAVSPEDCIAVVFSFSQPTCVTLGVIDPGLMRQTWVRQVRIGQLLGVLPLAASN